MAAKNKIKPAKKENPKVAPITDAPKINIPKKKKINFLVNYILLIVTAFVLFLIYINVPSYQWVKKELIGQNLEIIKKNKRLKDDDKLERLKFGFDYSIVKILKEKTDEQSIILMPSDLVKLDSIRKSNNAALPSNQGGIINSNWVNYYLYPKRKVVYDSTYPGITHIAVIGCMNLEKLSYQPEKINCFTVYPINPK